MNVTELLHQRKSNSSKPCFRDDDRHISLVIEGGAMRGVVTAGMVAGLEELGLRDCFDSVYGSSAGSISGAYFVTGQARRGTTIFYEQINNEKFIDLRKLISGGPVVNLDFLLHDVCKNIIPLNAKYLLESDIPLNICVSSVNRNESVCFNEFEAEEVIFEVLKAGANVPYFSGPPVSIDGELYTDACVYESIPYRSALNGGATDLVILLSRPEGYSRGKPNFIDKLVVAKHLRKYNNTIADDYLKRSEFYQAELNEIKKLVSNDLVGRTLVIQQPSSSKKVGSFEKSKPKLERGAADGYEATYRAIVGSEQKVVEVLATEGHVHS